MKSIFISLLFWTIILNVNAQIGISGTYNQIKHPDWSPIFEASTFFDFEQDYHLPNTTGMSIDYWLQPLDFRVEFLPTLSYMLFQDTYNRDAISTDMRLEMKLFDLSLPIHFYVFDMEGDCDCPTWGKDGSLVKKGFYLSVIPGVSFVENSSTILMPQSSFKSSGGSTLLNIGIGAGLDIGLAKFVTLTPFINYKRHFDLNWDALIGELGAFTTDADGTSNINQLQAGIRLGIHFKK